MCIYSCALVVMPTGEKLILRVTHAAVWSRKWLCFVYLLHAALQTTVWQRSFDSRPIFCVDSGIFQRVANDGRTTAL